MRLHVSWIQHRFAWLARLANVPAVEYVHDWTSRHAFLGEFFNVEKDKIYVVFSSTRVTR